MLINFFFCLLISDSFRQSMNPLNGLQVGETVTLTCILSYNSPPIRDLNAPFPLSNDQDPKLSMLIGQKEILGEEVVDVTTVPHRKTLVSKIDLFHSFFTLLISIGKDEEKLASRFHNSSLQVTRTVVQRKH